MKALTSALIVAPLLFVQATARGESQLEPMSFEQIGTVQNVDLLRLGIQIDGTMYRMTLDSQISTALTALPIQLLNLRPGARVGFAARYPASGGTPTLDKVWLLGPE